MATGTRVRDGVLSLPVSLVLASERPSSPRSAHSSGSWLETRSMADGDDGKVDETWFSGVSRREATSIYSDCEKGRPWLTPATVSSANSPVILLARDERSWRQRYGRCMLVGGAIVIAAIITILATFVAFSRRHADDAASWRPGVGTTTVDGQDGREATLSLVDTASSGSSSPLLTGPTLPIASLASPTRAGRSSLSARLSRSATTSLTGSSTTASPLPSIPFRSQALVAVNAARSSLSSPTLAYAPSLEVTAATLASTCSFVPSGALNAGYAMALGSADIAGAVAEWMAQADPHYRMQVLAGGATRLGCAVQTTCAGGPLYVCQWDATYAPEIAAAPAPSPSPAQVVAPAPMIAPSPAPPAPAPAPFAAVSPPTTSTRWTNNWTQGGNGGGEGRGWRERVRRAGR